MNQIAQAHTEWLSALREGCHLVNKACLPGDGEDDLRRGRLVAMALLIGASDSSSLQELLIQNREDLITLIVKRHVH